MKNIIKQGEKMSVRCKRVIVTDENGQDRIFEKGKDNIREIQLCNEFKVLKYRFQGYDEAVVVNLGKVAQWIYVEDDEIGEKI